MSQNKNKEYTHIINSIWFPGQYVSIVLPSSHYKHRSDLIHCDKYIYLLEALRSCNPPPSLWYTLKFSSILQHFISASCSLLYCE